MNIERLVVGELQTSCYILTEGDDTLIIDPGGDHQKIIEHVKTENATIVNTHYHFDHTSANNILREELGAKVLIHENEKKYIDFEADDFLKEGDILKVGKTELKVIHTPGHTQGCICLLEKDNVFTGDTLFENGYGRTDLPGGDDAEMFKSLKKLEEMLTEGMMVYPGHGQPFKWAK